MNSIREDIVFISSGGGHFKQLQIVYEMLKPIIKKNKISYTFISTKNNKLVNANITSINNGLLNKILNIIESFMFAYKLSPILIISTGSGDVLAFLVFSKLLGSEILFIDSIHNINKLSKTGSILNKLKLCKIIHQHDNNYWEYWGKLI